VVAKLFPTPDCKNVSLVCPGANHLSKVSEVPAHLYGDSYRLRSIVRIETVASAAYVPRARLAVSAGNWIGMHVGRGGTAIHPRTHGSSAFPRVSGSRNAATAIVAYARPANNPMACPKGIRAESTPTIAGNSAPVARPTL
jgi:hypothetical protein